MATTFTLPKHLFTGESRQQLIGGLEEVTGLSCPLTLHYGLLSSLRSAEKELHRPLTDDEEP